MIPLTISLIAFALILAVVVNRRHLKKIKAQDEKICRYIKAFNDTNATYTVATTIDGRVGVCRNSVINGYWHRTVIKLFADPDQDFNRREAEELVEHLNEK